MNIMITPAYESFVNDIAMELFGLSKKEKLDKMPDELFAQNGCYSAYDELLDRLGMLMRNPNISTEDIANGLCDGKEALIKQYCENHNKDYIDERYKDDYFCRIQVYMHGEIIESKKETKNDITFKTRSVEGAEISCTKDKLYYALLLDKKTLNKKYPRNDFPELIIYDHFNNAYVPIYDEFAHVAVLCDREKGKVYVYPLMKYDDGIKRLHNGTFKSSYKFIK